MIQNQLFDTERNILMSLKEKPFNEIINYKKRYEYRTRFFFEESKAYIYLSKHKKLVAIIHFGIPKKENAMLVSQFASKHDHENYDEFSEWLNGRDCFIIPIRRVEIIEPISLDILKNKFPRFTVPQSYYDLDKKEDLLNYLNFKSKIIKTVSLGENSYDLLQKNL